jgi:hypothetical protein
MNRLADQISADSGLLSTTISQTVAGSRQTVRYGALLTLSDHERLRVFIQEFVVHGLIPWAEKTIRNLSEQVGKNHGTNGGNVLFRLLWTAGTLLFEQLADEVFTALCHGKIMLVFHAVQYRWISLHYFFLNTNSGRMFRLYARHLNELRSFIDVINICYTWMRLICYKTMLEISAIEPKTDSSKFAVVFAVEHQSVLCYNLPQNLDYWTDEQLQQLASGVEV